LCALLLAPGIWAADYTFMPALPVADAPAMPLLDLARCGSRLVAVGERGLAIYSDDMGESWVQAEMPVSQTLTAVYCLPSGKAWAVGHGGVILHSDDAGFNWSLQFDGNQANQQWLDYTRQHKAALEVAVAGTADAAAANMELALEDAHYAIEDAEDAVLTGPADPFLDIWFRNEHQGIAVGAYGMLYRTGNGGDSWELSIAGIDNPYRYHYYSIAETEEGVLFLSGEAGLLYRSLNEGVIWDRLDSNYDGSLFGLVVTQDQAVLGFGLRGNILLSTDGGDSWQPVAIRDNPRLSLYGGARLADGSIALVGATGALVTSGDHGREFQGRVTAERNSLSAVAGESLHDSIAVGLAGLELLDEGEQ
jgi:photosystem II stability/assembly factor-like uncharacterized protein